MRSIVSGLQKLDAFVQTKFDGCVFFLMRRLGWSKSTIRYVLWAVMILAIMISIGCIFIGNGHKWSGRATVNIVQLALLILIQWGDRICDQEAEEIGERSYADRIEKGHQGWKLAFAIALVAVTVMLFIGWSHPERLNIRQELISNMRADVTANWIFFWSNLAMFYLVKTPPTAPPVKESKTVLVPAPQRLS